jgi:hypothetical protein
MASLLRTRQRLGNHAQHALRFLRFMAGSARRMR